MRMFIPVYYNLDPYYYFIHNYDTVLIKFNAEIRD